MKISYNSQPQRNLIGNQIFKLRKSRKLSQKERLVTDIELKILCDYFHITPNDLLGYGDDGRLV